jgi:hypothetical protein
LSISREAIYVERRSIWHVVEIKKDKRRWSMKFDSRQSVEFYLEPDLLPRFYHHAKPFQETFVGRSGKRVEF